MLIVSAVKICQTASFCGATTDASPLDPTGGLLTPDPLGYTPKWNFLAPLLLQNFIWCSRDSSP